VDAGRYRTKQHNWGIALSSPQFIAAGSLLSFYPDQIRCVPRLRRNDLETMLLSLIDHDDFISRRASAKGVL
jgi:hypothetical protein